LAPSLAEELYTRRTELSLPLPLTFMLANLVLNSLNVYWFYLMVKSIAKRFEPKKGGEDGEKKE
jgi:hypothetical protein